MSARAIRRARERELRRAERREERLGKRGRIAAGAGAALCTTILSGALLAPGASAATYTVTKLDDDGSEGTLRQEIKDANANPGFDTVVFEQGLSGQINLNTAPGYTDIEIYDPLEIEGPGQDQITVSGVDQTQIFDADMPNPGDPLIVSGLRLVDGDSSNGGAIYLYDAELTLTDVTISGSHADINGGAIAVGNEGELNLLFTTLSGNDADGDGGGIYLYYGNALIRRSEISGNDAGDDGGAVTGDYSSVEVDNSTIADNTAVDDGGGIFLYSDSAYDRVSLAVEDSTVSGNDAGSNGGGVLLYNASTVVVEDSTIGPDNTAEYWGGGLSLYSVRDLLQIKGSTVTGNSAGYGAGGAGVWDLYYGARGVIKNSTLSGNSAGQNGGGLNLYDAQDLTIESTTIANNTANADGTGTYEGGGIYALYDTEGKSVVLNNTLVADNTPDDLGTDDEAEFLLDHSLVENSDDASVVETGHNVRFTDPQLEPLADNGGPTQTHALPKSSPAVDQGLSFGLFEDQRAFPRPVDLPDVANAPGGDGSDIGAFERQAEPPPPPPPLTGVCRGQTATIVVSDPNTVTDGTESRDVIVGTAGPDDINADAGRDLICAKGGNDIVRAEGGNDRGFGQRGNDRLAGFNGKDVLTGGAGGDTIGGGDGKDILRGNAGGDILRGRAAADVLNGGPGNDNCRGGPGDDRQRSC